MLSARGAVQKAEWEALDIGQVIEARCIGMVKGGLELEVANHKAFMPASQVDTHFVKDISIFLNEKVRCEIIELNRKRGRIVLSRRKVVAAEQERRREELLGTLEIGRQMTGVITTIQPYGAFADIGGIDGLIHISDMSYERINHPSEVVKVGDQVNVKILKLEQDDSGEVTRIDLGSSRRSRTPTRPRSGPSRSGPRMGHEADGHFGDLLSSLRGSRA